jgi:hypothetical protein
MKYHKTNFSYKLEYRRYIDGNMVGTSLSKNSWSLVFVCVCYDAIEIKIGWSCMLILCVDVNRCFNISF